jgi:hypothetical protein
MKQVVSTYGSYLDLFFGPENGGYTILRNVGSSSMDYRVLYHRKQNSP